MTATSIEGASGSSPRQVDESRRQPTGRGEWSAIPNQSSLWIVLPLILSFGAPIFSFSGDTERGPLGSQIAAWHVVRVAATLWMLAAAIHGFWREANFGSMARAPNAWLLAFVSYAFFTCFLSDSPLLCLFYCLESLAVFLTTWRIVCQPNRDRLIMRVLFALVVITLATALRGVVLWSAPLSWATFRSNTGGFVAAYAVLFSLARVFERWTAGRQWLQLSAWVALLVMFQSTASILAAAVGSAVFLLTSVTRLRVFAVASGLAVAAYGGWLYFRLLDQSGGLPDQVQLLHVSFGRTEGDASSLSGRLPLWVAALEFTRDTDLVLGGGYGIFERNLVGNPRFVSLAHTPEGIGHVHSAFLSAFLGTGYPGLAMVIGWYVSSFLASMRRRRELPFFVAGTCAIFANSATINGLGSAMDLGVLVAMLHASLLARASADGEGTVG